jgi:hypothetical protein
MWVKYSESLWSSDLTAGALQTTVDVSPSKGVFGSLLITSNVWTHA